MPTLADMDRQKEFVLRTLEERDIRFVRLWFTDVVGTLKSVAIAPAELEGAFEEGIGFDGSAIEGFSRISEADMVARPDATTFQVLPWMDDRGHQYSARMFCDITMPGGTPSWADPRHVLRRQLNKASDLASAVTCTPRSSSSSSRTANPAHCRFRPTTGATSTSRSTVRRRTSVATPSTHSNRWESPSSSAITRLRPVSRRST